MIKFKCLHCGQSISAETEHFGTTVACPACSGELTVPSDLSAEEGKPHSIEESAIPPPISPRETLHQTPPTEVSTDAHTALPDPVPPAERTVPPVQESTAERSDKLSTEDDRKLWGLRGAMLVMPLFMFYVAVFLFHFWEAIDIRMGTWVFKVAIPLFLILLGVSLRSLQCIFWLKSDPYRAAAIGKNLFLIFLILATLSTIIGEFPKAHIQAPLDAVFERPSYNTFGGSTTEYILNVNEAFVYKPNFLWWVGYLLAVSQQLIEHLAIYSFVVLLYHSLKGPRPHFGVEHFLNEISFGKYGKAYAWDFPEK